MATMHRVREHLTAQAEAHRKHRDDALREAAIARAEADAHQGPAEPPGGLLGPDEGLLDMDAE